MKPKGLNPRTKPSAIPKLDPNTTDPFAVLRDIAGDQFNPKVFETQEGYRGVCLRAELGSGIGTAASWVSRSDQNDDELIAVKVMIPEVHAHLCNPFVVNGEGCNNFTGLDQRLVDLYPTFLAKIKDFSTDFPAPGDIVAVDFGNRSTMTDPIYKGKVFSQPTVFALAAKGAKNSFCLRLPPLESVSHDYGSDTDELSLVVSVKFPPERLYSPAAEAFNKMVEEALKEGVEFLATSGFRSIEEQRVLYEKHRRDPKNNPPAAKPGKSKHNSGLAVDIWPLGRNASKASPFLSYKAREWLRKNAGRYGFRRTDSREEWHFVWSQESKEQPKWYTKITFEEWKVKVNKYKAKVRK